MAVGSAVFVGPTSVGNGSFLDLQATSGQEWVIHNLGLPPAASGYELHTYDGSTSTLVDTLDGSVYNVLLHCTNTKRWRVKNVSGGSLVLMADGVQQV